MSSRVADGRDPPQRQRRRDCPGPPAGVHGSQTDDEPHLRTAAPAGALWARDDVRRRRNGRCWGSGAPPITMTSAHKGGPWLLEPGDAKSVLTPERLSDEHRLIAQTAREFAAKEVIPAIDRLEKKDWTFARQLLQRAGEL